MNTAIIKLTISLLLGICLGFFLELSLKMAFLGLLVGMVLFLFGYFRAKKLLFQDIFFGSITFLLFLLLGIFITTIHLPQNQPKHYLNKISSEETPVLQLRIKESLKADLYNHKFIAEVISVNRNTSHGMLLLLQPKDSLKMSFLEGEEIWVSGNVSVVPSPLNPHQFDYSKFMARKGVWRQLNLKNSSYHKLPGLDQGIRTRAAKFRKDIISALQQKDFGKEELAVVQALLLGQKQDISKETYNNFAAAGAIHILAVSGLHVGIILLILHRIFAPIKRLKKGKILKTFFIIIILWGFAILAGLSPSVVRAVTMFSFIAVGMELKRHTGTLNSVFLSLLILLLIRPQWIFEVGFQLSYMAVISIVLFQPLISRLYSPTSGAVRYIWNLLSVTIAAQIGVLPLSLYYFHQFPGLFFLSNLLILPFLGLILIMGIVVIFLALTGLLPQIVLKSYEMIIETLNRTVEIIAKQEQFLFRDIPFSLKEVWGWYLLIFMIYFSWKYFNYKKLYGLFVAVIILQGIYIFQKTNVEDQLVIFHRSRGSIIGVTENQNLKLHQALTERPSELPLIKNYVIGERISEVQEKELRNIYLQKGHFLILLDSTGIFPESLPEKPKLLLSGSPRINLERVVETVKPSAVIADGSNYPLAVKTWRKTALEKGIPFHYTGEDGALILK